MKANNGANLSDVTKIYNWVLKTCAALAAYLLRRARALPRRQPVLVGTLMFARSTGCELHELCAEPKPSSV